MNNLTGKTRYRVHTIGWLGPKTHLLVLQVEEKYSDGPNDRKGLPTYLGGTHWRDAATEDLASLDIQSHTR